ncbi:MAG TPA: hypothetical protein PKD85_05675, partial [Saprospiraceae bacterium]|nr:hypothetical protein [Saprospiraceae bacterium]
MIISFFIALVFIRWISYFVLAKKILAHKEYDAHDTTQGVSVLISAKNAINNLQHNLDSILNQ